MSFYADPRKDLPAPWKEKRVVIYRQGLKIYGQIPYILQRRLQAEFFSNNAPFMGSRLLAPTGEDNYTLVPWRSKDGRTHSQEAVRALLDWLYADKGFTWAVAAAPEFYERQDEWNAWKEPPRTWVPAQESHYPAFTRLLTAPEFETPDDIENRIGDHHDEI
jgi:hypothetical protein